MKRFWLGVGFFLVLLSSSFTVLSVFMQKTAYAAGLSNLDIHANFIDAAHINVGVTGTYTAENGDKVDLAPLSGIYYDRNIGDNGLTGGTFAQGGDKKVGVTGGCQSKVFIPGFIIGANDFPAAWTFEIPPKGTTATQCITQTVGSNDKPSTTYTADSGPMGDSGRAGIYYYVSDLSHINAVDNDPAFDSGEDSKFALTKVANGTSTIGKGDKFLFDKDHPSFGGRCPNYMQITADQTGNDVIVGSLYDQDNAGGNSCKLTPSSTSHPNPIPNTFILVNTPSQIAQGNTQLPTTGGSTDTGGDPNVALQDNCPLTEWWQLKWIACPIIESINGFINDISKQIQDSLLIDVDGWFGTGASAGAVKTAFNSFRAIGLSILVAAAVAMVASQASGFEALDALTVRRFMPQFVISVILISVLWPLEKVAVQLINELSLWVPDAMYAPFLHIRNDINAIDGWSLLTALLTAVGGLVALGPFGFLSFLVTAFFSLIMAAIIITIVKMMLLGALIVMPMALAFRPIPNMKFIWDFVIRIVQGAAIFTIVIPIIFALGKILAILLPPGNTGSGSLGNDVFSHAASIVFGDAAGGFLRSLAVFACIIGPMWTVPTVAEETLGKAARLTGLVKNGVGRLSGGVSKYRQSTLQQRGAAFKSGSLYQDKGVVRSRINNLGRRTNIGAKGFSPFHKGQANALLSLQQAVDAENAGKANPLLGQLAMDDDANAVLALSGGSATEASRAAQSLFRSEDGSYDAVRGQAALDKAKAVGIQRSNSAYAFKSMMQNKARAIGAGRIDLVEMGAQNLAGSNTDLYKSLMFEAAYNARGSGRNDLGGTSITQSDKSVQDLQRGAATNGITVGAQEARSHLTTMDGMARTTVGQMMNGHTNQAKADTAAIKFMLNNGSETQKTIALQRANEIAKNLSQANGDSQKEFNQFISELGVDTSSTETFSVQLARNYNPNPTRYATSEALARTIESGSRTYGNEAAYVGGQQPPTK